MAAAAGQPGADWTPGETQPAKWMDPHQRTYYKEATREAPPYPIRPFDETGPPPQGHVNRPNSFTGMSDPVRERNEKLQQILNKTLGADYIASRQGGGGSKLNYLEGWRAINLANEVFGFNGWFTDIKYLEADFVDFDPASERWHVGVTAIVRVRLQDGSSHEDVGYGKMENCRSKGEALDKSKKEAVTDGLKRALRHFGKLLGNCLYDKHYLEHIKNVKAPKPKLDWDAMYKPERDNLAAMSAAASYVPNGAAAPPPPAFEGAGPSAAPAPKREPPGAVPAAFTAKVQRASTVGGIPQPQPQPQPPQQQTSRPPAPKPPAPAPMNGATRPSGPGAPKPVARPVPVQQQQQQARQHQPPQPQPVKKPIQRATTVPNPAVRSGAGGGATTPSIASDDDSLFAAMELPGEEELIGGGGGGNVSVATTAAAGGGIRDDSGFAEWDGLADSSVVVGGAIVGMEKKLPTSNNAPMPDQQPVAVVPQAAAGVGSHAHAHTHASVETANQVEQRRLDAMQRLAAKQRQKKLEQQQQQARTATGAAPPPPPPPAMLVPPTQDPSLVSAARMLAQNNGPAPGAGAQQPGLPMHGNARPPALRPNQPPPQAQGGGGGVARTNSMQRTKSVGQNVVGGGPKVAGTLPSLNVGAGMVKAAAGHMEAVTGGAGGQAYGADGIGADGVAFQSARGMKRSADHQGGEYAAASWNNNATTSAAAAAANNQPRRHSTSPRQALKELAVDESTGDVKRQRTSYG